MGGILNPDEVKRFQSLQDYFDVATTAKRLDDYGKWIFSTVTLVAALATGFTFFTSQSFQTPAKIVYGVAMLFVGLSLGCSVMMLSPAFPKLKLGSPSDLNQKFSASIRGRRKWTFGAAACLSLGFLTAGLAPVVSALCKAPVPAANPTTTFTYSFVANKLVISLHLSGLMPGSPATLQIDKDVSATPTSPKLPVFVDHATADDHGKLERTVTLEKAAFDPLLVEYKGKLSTGSDLNGSESIRLATP